MLRKVIAVIVGFLVCPLVEFSMASIDTPLGLACLWDVLNPFSVIPPLAGGLLTGYIARQRGWVYGFIVGCLYMTQRIIVTNYLISIIVPPSDFIPYVTSVLHLISGITLSFICCTLISSTIGGYLGQLLAQIWHKRAHKKSDASQSETN